MRTSLIVTTYNWPAALHLTLASIARQKRLPDELIVADDGSGADTAAVIKTWSQRLACSVMHQWQEDKGFRLARSRNRAIAAAGGDYLILIDGDMVLHPRFIADHIDCARKDSFIQGARPHLDRQATQRLLRSGIPNIGLLSRGVQRRAYAWRNAMLSRLLSSAKHSLAGIQGCNQSFWREHVIAVNGYDERFTGWGPEDREFAARLLQIGLKRNYVRHRAVAWHLHHRSRAPLQDNPFDRLLEQTLRNRTVRCALGVDQHLKQAGHTADAPVHPAGPSPRIVHAPSRK